MTERLVALRRAPALGGSGRADRAPRPATGPSGSRLRHLVRGRPEDPAWVRPGLAALLLLAAVLCLWNLSENGYSNEYYAAAVKSATESWKAWFFGSLDPGSFITVDKPPLSIWMMGLSGRLLGFSSFSMLLPGALCTIGAVALLYATVKRAFGPAAGLMAGLALAITPITIAIGRVNNPDALLILLLVASAYFTQRAIADGKTKWLLWTGVVVGLAFMTKMLQGWMVVPALSGAYLLAGPRRLPVRVGQLAGAGAVMVAVSAAWPTAVSLWPGSAPYIGGSDDGSAWDLIFGYNGFGRLTGEEGGMGGGGGASFGGVAGPWRMFNEQVGAQIAWLIPLAGLSLVAGLWLTRRAPRTDARRAAWVLFGVWSLVHVAVFSSAKGIFHPYYVSALAPGIAALSGAGIASLTGWAKRSWAGFAALAAGIVASAAMAVELLGRADGFLPALPVVIGVAAAVAVLAALALRIPRLGGRRLLAVAAVAGMIAVAAGPASYAAANLGRQLDGNNVLAGPASAASGGLGGGPGGPGGGMGRMGGTPPSGGTAPSGAMGAMGGGGGGMGGSISTEVTDYLLANQGSAKYLLAASGSQTTAGIIIATGKAVVTIGGFGGSDPTPTVSELAQLVADGDLKYVLVSSGGQGGGGGGGSSSALTSWVEAHGTAVTDVTVSGGTLYEVTA